MQVLYESAWMAEFWKLKLVRGAEAEAAQFGKIYQETISIFRMIVWVHMVRN